MRRTSTDSLSRRSARSTPGTVGRVPTSARQVGAVLDGLGIIPSKGRGQSFLVDPAVAGAEAALVGTAPGEPVLEIGGGLGILTHALLARGLGPLTVIEKDPRLAAFLRYHFGSRIRVVEADALVEPLPAVGVIVGNLPFSIATPLLLRLFREGVPRVIALVQREVAERLTALPGTRDYGRLTVLAALYGRTERLEVVPASAFHPTPEVEGRLVVFHRRDGSLPVPDPEVLEELLRDLFGRRRKQLGNLIPDAFRRRGIQTPPEGTLQAAGWPEGWSRLRPENIPPEPYFHLAALLSGLYPPSHPHDPEVP